MPSISVQSSEMSKVFTQSCTRCCWLAALLPLDCLVQRRLQTCGVQYVQELLRWQRRHPRPEMTSRKLRPIYLVDTIVWCCIQFTSKYDIRDEYVYIFYTYTYLYIHMYINIILLQITIMSNIKWHAKSGFERTHSIGGLDCKRLESSPNCSEAPWTAEKRRSCARNRFAMIRTCKVTSRFWTSVQKISTLFAKKLNQSTWATTHGWSKFFKNLKCWQMLFHPYFTCP